MLDPVWFIGLSDSSTEDSFTSWLVIFDAFEFFFSTEGAPKFCYCFNITLCFVMRVHMIKSDRRVNIVNNFKLGEFTKLSKGR